MEVDPESQAGAARHMIDRKLKFRVVEDQAASPA